MLLALIAIVFITWLVFGYFTYGGWVAKQFELDDTRETPATPVMRQLLELGAHVRLHDQWIADYELDHEVARVDLTVDEVSTADVVVVLTDHDTVDYQLVADHASAVFDARHVVVGENVEYL